jgi:hypothetical protein
MSLVPRAKVLLLGALAGALSISAVAQTKLTLQQAVAVALGKNPVRKAAFFEQRAAVAAFKLSRAPLLAGIVFIETCQSPAAQPR